MKTRGIGLYEYVVDKKKRKVKILSILEDYELYIGESFRVRKDSNYSLLTKTFDRLYLNNFAENIVYILPKHKRSLLKQVIVSLKRWLF